MQDLAGLRNVLQFPMRHKKKKKDIKLPVEIVTNTDEVKIVDVSPEDYYPFVTLPAFRPPACLTNEKYDTGIELIGYSTTAVSRSMYQDRLDKFARDYDAKEIAIYTLKYPEDWARLFAKASYALAVRDYGPGRFKVEDVYVLNSILGNKNDVGMWVGGVEQEDLVYGDEYDDQVVGLWEKEGEIHAVIKLFPFLNTVPEYQVIVGKLS